MIKNDQLRPMTLPTTIGSPARPALDFSSLELTNFDPGDSRQKKAFVTMHIDGRSRSAVLTGNAVDGIKLQTQDRMLPAIAGLALTPAEVRAYASALAPAVERLLSGR